jgi:hypothetical protein
MQFFDNKIFIALCVMLFLAPQALWAPKVKDVKGLQKYVASLGVTWDDDTQISEKQAEYWKTNRTYYEGKDVSAIKLESGDFAGFHKLLTKAHALPEKTTTSTAHSTSTATSTTVAQRTESGSSQETTSRPTQAGRGEAAQGTDRAPTSTPRPKMQRSQSESKLTSGSKPSSTTAAGDEHATATAEGSGRPAAQPARVASGGSTLHVVVQPSTIKSSVASEDSPTSLALVPSSPTKSSSTWSVGSFDSEDSEDPSSRTVAAPAVKLRRNEIGSRGAAFRARLAPKTREELLRGLESYGKSSRETEIAAKLEKLSENISGHEQAGTLHATVGATSTTNAQALEDKLFALKHEHAKAFGTKQDRAALKKEYQELLKSRKAASRQAAAPKEPPHSAPEASPQTPLKTSPHSPGSTFGKTVSHARRQPAQR